MSGWFVAIEGPTGVGKTTLAARLASVLDAEAVFESFEANPFLPQLLLAGGAVSIELALRVELTFLALRVAQLRHIDAILASGHSVVADWALLKQSIFAAISLAADDLARIAATCDVWAVSLPAPDVLIGLSATATLLLGRVRQRSRAMEAALTAADLTSLSAAFDHAYRQWDRPLIRVDTTTFNAFDDRHLTELATQVRQLLIPWSPDEATRPQRRWRDGHRRTVL